MLSQNAVAANKLNISLRHHQCATVHLNFPSLATHTKCWSQASWIFTKKWGFLISANNQGHAFINFKGNTCRKKKTVLPCLKEGSCCSFWWCSDFSRDVCLRYTSIRLCVFFV